MNLLLKGRQFDSSEDHLVQPLVGKPDEGGDLINHIFRWKETDTGAYFIPSIAELFEVRSRSTKGRGE
jgi:hypothetical protein